VGRLSFCSNDRSNVVDVCTTCGSSLKADAKFCSTCGKPVIAPAVTSPPAIEIPAPVHRHPMGRKAKLLYSLTGLSLFGIFITLFVLHLPGGAHPVIAGQPEIAMATMYTGQMIEPQAIDVEVRNGKITFPLSVLLAKKAVMFDYQLPSGKVPLLAFISAEGKLVTAVRMCEPCNSSTFRIEGTELACGNCETRWKLNNLEGIQGSCQKYPPDPIPSTLVGDQVQIEESVVQHWKMRI